MKPCLSAGVSRSNSLTGGPSQYFYWDDIPARRMRPETLDRETALEKAKSLAKAEQDKLK
jgi:hypothetical protein